MTKKATRSIERELFIDADPERVWDAFTSADEIVNWFAIHAESKPGVGGYIGLGWDMKDVEPGRCQITDWKSHEYLRMSWRDDPGGEHELPVELWLTRKDGGTLLRLVHSGFLSDASWDDEYESHGRGWSYELRSLKYYLERQYGRSREFILQRFPVSGDARSSWDRVIGEAGALKVGLDALAEGAEVLLELPHGSITAGELVYANDGQDFVATAALLDGGMFRFALETMTGVPEIWVWAFSWQLSQEEIRVLTQPLYEAIAARLADMAA